MDLGLTRKLALVTGSTAGIGFSVARQLAREGATVYVNGRTQARVDRAILQIGGASVKGVVADLTTRAGATRWSPRSRASTCS
jgi:NAD(P)-dependent dehydrogenase (short-subunit alcohol dehydrogenase family)